MLLQQHIREGTFSEGDGRPGEIAAISGSFSREGVLPVM